jgi:uncharacterized protein YgiM (DUF1202 family)
MAYQPRWVVIVARVVAVSMTASWMLTSTDTLNVRSGPANDEAVAGASSGSAIA